MGLCTRFYFVAGGMVLACGAATSARPVPETVGPPPATFLQAEVYGCGDPQCAIVLGTISKFNPVPVTNAFRWTTADGFTNLAAASGLPNMRYAVPSSDGTAYVGTAENRQGVFHWVPPAAPVTIAVPPGIVFSASEAISADGRTIAGVISPSPNGAGSRGFVWTPTGGLVEMNLPTGSSWINVDWISADGTTVRGDGYTPGGVRAAFIWTASGGPAFISSPAGVPDWIGVQASVSGTALAGRCGNINGNLESLAVWRNGVNRNYGLPPAPYNGQTPRAISDDGGTVVGQMYNTSNGNTAGYVWKRSTGFLPVKEYLASLGWDVSGWNLMNDVTGISADGRTIVGTGRSQGVTVGWRATNAIPPACDGDFDGNGSVNTADLTAFLAAFGTCPGGSGYRINLNVDESDPCITTADLVALLGAFGRACN
jgi:uncharacterized membrane protein